MNIEIIDLGINNISSIYRSIVASAGSEDKVIAIEEADESANPDLLILPGLGHFEAGMNKLRTKNFDDMIFRHVTSRRKIVGICLGMQLMCRDSEESPGVQGLGLVDANVKKLPPLERVPNIGWNSTSKMKETEFFSSLSSQRDFYFVHSYHVELNNSNDLLSQSPFANQEIVSSFLCDEILGVQFHPEKSGKVGKDFMEELIVWSTK
jgi:glutamine amidotransferase